MKTLYIDIEVSPNIVFAWSTGYKLQIPYENIISERAIICICYKFSSDKSVSSLKWSAKQDDKKMLEKFAEIAREADYVIGHNGDRFDVKWIKTRCLYHRIPFNIDFRTIDTLKLAKSNFYFNSNRLDYIGEYLFGTGKSDNGGFQTWKQIVLHNDKSALKTMIEYCKRDVELLQQVHELFEEYKAPNFHVGVVNGRDRYTCPKCGGTHIIMKANAVSTKGIKTKRVFCKGCKYQYRIAWSVYLNYLDDKLQGRI